MRPASICASVYRLSASGTATRRRCKLNRKNATLPAFTRPQCIPVSHLKPPAKCAPIPSKPIPSQITQAHRAPQIHSEPFPHITVLPRHKIPYLAYSVRPSRNPQGNQTRKYVTITTKRAHLFTITLTTQFASVYIIKLSKAIKLKELLIYNSRWASQNVPGLVSTYVKGRNTGSDGEFG